MDFEEAFEEYKKGNRTDEVVHAILQDAYGFLESENFHTAIEVIEELTRVPYE